MLQMSSLPLLCVALAAFWMALIFAGRRARLIDGFDATLVTTWLIALGLWGVISATLAVRGAYDTQAFYSTLPGLWLPVVVMVLTGTLVTISVRFRTALLSLFTQWDRAFVALQAVRILAVGGVAKTYAGLFPQSFGYLIGVPDMLFGLSAFVMLFVMIRWHVSRRILILWNLIGLMVILPAPLVLQLSIPGPAYFFTGLPDGGALFDFPMVLAPSLVVPLLITMNALHAGALLWGADGVLSNQKETDHACTT